MDTARLKLVSAGVLGLFAPLWWSWALSQIAYIVYVASGSPDRPSELLVWASVYVPSFFLGAAAGVAVSLLDSGFPLRGLGVFLGSLLIGTIILALILGVSVALYFEAFYVPVGNRYFFVGLIMWPTISCMRKRAV